MAAASPFLFASAGDLDLEIVPANIGVTLSETALTFEPVEAGAVNLEAVDNPEVLLSSTGNVAADFSISGTDAVSGETADTWPLGEVAVPGNYRLEYFPTSEIIPTHEVPLTKSPVEAWSAVEPGTDAATRFRLDAPTVIEDVTAHQATISVIATYAD